MGKKSPITQIPKIIENVATQIPEQLGRGATFLLTGQDNQSDSVREPAAQAPSAAPAPIAEDPTNLPDIAEVRNTASIEQRKYLTKRRASSTLLSGIGNALDTPKTASSVLLGV